MLRVASEAHVCRILGERRQRSITIDIIPARGAVYVPRLDEDDDSLTSPAPTIQTITFHLEDAMFGSVCYVSITCQGRIIVNPFPWESWEALSRSTITNARSRV